jgi:imidazolonepropionase-like amidohydrolase
MVLIASLMSFKIRLVMEQIGSRFMPTIVGALKALRRRFPRTKLAVETARSANVRSAAHASTTEGMRRATLAGVETIEHGDGGTPEIFRLMKEHNVALCPTLSVGANPERKRPVFKAALMQV